MAPNRINSYKIKFPEDFAGYEKPFAVYYNSKKKGDVKNIYEALMLIEEEHTTKVEPQMRVSRGDIVRIKSGISHDEAVWGMVGQISDFTVTEEVIFFVKILELKDHPISSFTQDELIKLEEAE